MIVRNSVFQGWFVPEIAKISLWFPADSELSVDTGSTSRKFRFRRAGGFTIVELLVAMAVLALIAVLVLNIMSQTSSAVRTANERVESFQSAREGYDSLTRLLSQATLNTYYDYYDASRNVRTVANSADFVPSLYGRQSELHFLSGYGDDKGTSLVTGNWNPVSQSIFFQAPMGYAIDGAYVGKESLLNACGFFVAFTSDASQRPSELAGAQAAKMGDQYRFRLYRMSQPTESLKVYSGTDKSWFQAALSDSAGNPAVARQNGIYPMADNVIALVIWPKLPPSQEDYASPTLAPNYNYDTRAPWIAGAQSQWTTGIQPSQMHQLPPLLDVALVTIDENSAKRLLGSATTADTALAALGIPGLKAMFRDPKTMDTDLASLQSQLAAKGAKCRIFRSTIPIRSSKWSNPSN